MRDPLRKDSRKLILLQDVVKVVCVSGWVDKLACSLSDAAYLTIINGPHLQKLALGVSNKRKKRAGKAADLGVRYLHFGARDHLDQ